MPLTFDAFKEGDALPEVKKQPGVYADDSSRL